MRFLERITFLVAVACVFMSVGEVLADDHEPAYVVCKRESATVASCSPGTAGQACALGKTCSANATTSCGCL